jgi:adenine-specific DNA-methyltransferase
MDKLKMHSPNLTDTNIAHIRELFPGCMTEARGEDGSVKLAVDFDQLRQELSASLVDGPQERYHLNWPGKREALLTANAPIAKTLRPCREESVDFDTTKNLFIEGDNLDALKLLQETYLGKVKMIYIDPPYNTGNDFIYEDDFAENSGAYLTRSNQKDDRGNQLISNKESNGRFHSDWLTMLFSRLRLAHSLLRDDGVIFISIDDNEINNLRKICEEIFGEDNFIAQIVWKKRSTPPNDKVIAAQHEYILCFAKDIIKTILNLRTRSDDQIARYKNPDNHKKGPWVAGDLMANVKGGRYVASLYYPIVNPISGDEHYPSSNGNWRFSQEKIDQLIKNNEIYFGEDGQGRPKLKRFLCDVKDGITWTTLWDFAPLNTAGSAEIAALFGNLTTFENPKPTGLLIDLLRAGTRKNDLVLDFFAGSSSTADAVMQLNAEDGGNRAFIMVQLAETCDVSSEASKAGFRTIADLSKERIRRAGQRISSEQRAASSEQRLEGDVPESSAKSKNIWLDVGFRVLKIDTSNMAEVYYAPDALDKANLDLFIDNVKPDRKPEDLLFQVMLDWGVDLALPISTETIRVQKEEGGRMKDEGGGIKDEGGRMKDEKETAEDSSFRLHPSSFQEYEVFFVDGNALAACFDARGGIDEAFVKELAVHKPLRVVFRDAGFKDSAVKINVEQIFKLLSPATEVKCI